MNTLQTLLPTSLTDALGWTIFHTLWQGTLIAFVLGVAMILLRKASAKTRTVAAAVALFSTAVLAVLTFTALYEPESLTKSAVDVATMSLEESGTKIKKESVADEIAANAVANADAKALIAERLAAAEKLKAAKTLTFQEAKNKALKSLKFAPLTLPVSALPAGSAAWAERLQEYMPIVVIAWLVGAICLAMRFLGGMVYAQRMKHFRAYPAQAQWQRRIAEFAERVNVRRVPVLVESGLANAPMLVGFLKPVILVPMGFLSGLQTAHIEAIIAHEIAHARHNDYILSVVQAAIETLMFYHPAVWWMSSLIRQEREHAADDLAAELCGDSRALANALAILEERSLAEAESHFATAGVGANDGHLLTRVKRLLGKQPERTFSLEYLAAYCVMTSLFALSLTASPVLQPVVKPLVAPVVANVEKAASQMASSLSYRISAVMPPSAPDSPEQAAALDSTEERDYWLNDGSIGKEGFWEAKFKERSLALVMFKNKWGKNRYNGTMYTGLRYEEVQGLSASEALSRKGEISFRLAKESGAFVFTGEVENGKALGKYVFEPNKNFVEKLNSYGFTQATDKDLVTIALTDVKLDVFKELSGLKLSTEDAVEIGVLGIKPEFVREARKNGLDGQEIKEYGVLGINNEYIAEMKKYGYKIDEIKELGVLGIKPDYVNEMKKYGIKTEEIKEYGALGIRPDKVKELRDAGVPADEIKEYGVLGIKPEYVKEMKKLGYKVEEIKEIGVLGIKPDMVKAYKEAGVPVEDIKEYGVLGIKTDYIKEMKALGYKVEEIKEIGVLGIKPATVKAYKDAGLKVEDVKEFAILGIKSDFVKQMRAKGFSADDIKDFGVRGLSLDVISTLRDAGLNRDEISDMGVRGIKPAFVKQMKEYGFSKGDIEELGVRGIKADYAKQMRDMGFSADDIAEIGVRGIKAETAKEMKQMGFSADDIAELAVRGIKISTLQKLKADGLSNKRIVEVLTDND